jgi:hypothetical protein
MAANPVSTRELVRRYRQGQTLAEIGAAVGMHPGSVHRRLARVGLAMRRPSRRTEATVAEVRERHARGETLREIAAALDVAVSTVRRRLDGCPGARRAGGRRPGSPGRVKLDVAALVREYESGKNCREIAEAHGAKVPAVYLRLKAAGVQFRPPGGRRGGPASRP